MAKTAVEYKDGDGVNRVKHCGNAKGVRECITWIKRQGHELIGKKAVSESFGRLQKCK
ncbi:hypothetical protein GW933_04525 [Candidatus Falkowbacteria bacterium]|nr:hypothetical protein [Candidatus Falkowbacteria bacterium]